MLGFDFGQVIVLGVEEEGLGGLAVEAQGVVLLVVVCGYY